ncbi:MAG TPA: response regulator transcription factor [Terriglobales bacterium]|nr:response regulator transcription factor [Terriglobales bacterium]
MNRHHGARLLLADDHTLVAEACKSLLEPEFQVVGIVPDGRALLRAALEHRPDAVVVDVGMPLLNGLDAGEQIKRLLPAVKLVYLTMEAAPELAAEAFRRGASGYVLKSAAAEELVTALRRVLRGESYLSPQLTKETVNFLIRTRKPGLRERRITKRQREVLQLLAEGRSMKEVASVLDLKPGTVAFHKYRIMESLGVKTNAELLQYAIKQHMIPS